MRDEFDVDELLRLGDLESGPPVVFLPRSMRPAIEALIASPPPERPEGSAALDGDHLAYLEALHGWLLARQVEIRYSDFVPDGRAILTGELAEAAAEIRRERERNG